MKTAAPGGSSKLPASLMKTAAPGGSSKLPAILMILPNDHHLLQKQQHILLTQMTFETFLNPKQEEQE